MVVSKGNYGHCIDSQLRYNTNMNHLIYYVSIKFNILKKYLSKGDYMYKQILLITTLTDENSKTLMKAVDLAKSTDANLIIAHLDTSEVDSATTGAYNSINGMVNYKDYAIDYDQEIKKKSANFEAYEYIVDALNTKNIDTNIISIFTRDLVSTTLEEICPNFNVDLIVCSSTINDNRFAYFGKKITSQFVKKSNIDLLVTK